MDEQQLLIGLRNREPATVQELVETLGPRLLRSAFLLCGNETEAQDLVQDTLIEAIRSVHRYRGRASLHTWLYSILLNLSRHYHRDRKRLVGVGGFAREELSEPEDVQARMDCGVASAALLDALGNLSAAHREVLVLRFFEELKIQEIASRLGLSCGTVKSRLHYALAQMRQLLPAELNLFGHEGTKEKR